MNDVLDFGNKKIVVTGASSGIGRSVAEYLNGLGASVILIARREEKLQEVISGLNGNGNRYYSYDLSNIDGIGDLIKKIVNENGPIQGFVGCAGISSSRPLHLLDYEYMKNVMDINFFSFVEVIRNITKRNSYTPGLSIVGISSISSMQGIITETAYASSKAAMNMAVRCLSRELGRKNIRINAIAPGYISGTGITECIESSDNQKQYVEKIMEKQTLGEGKPSDIAKISAFLLSDLSSFITGTTILADGGNLA
jgi:NAD(P)-dependent dehydrogenase (short-subunit alcohol dehydrogenase family)